MARILVPPVDLHKTTDALVWAQEFVRIMEENCLLNVNVEIMTGWFANAIMVGYDWGVRNAKKTGGLCKESEVTWVEECKPVRRVRGKHWSEVRTPHGG